jgi:hypothetical protein
MDLRAFLDDLQERLPHDFVRIDRTVAPHQFEVTALLQHLENQKKFPVLFFEKPLGIDGKPSAFPLLSNVFATRQRCALSLGMKTNQGELPLSLEYARKKKVSLGSYAAGSFAHIVCVELNKLYGLDMVVVNYRGEAPMWQDMHAGAIQAAVGSYQAALSVIDAGTGRAIAVQTTKRMRKLPDVATFIEQGLVHPQ